LDAKGRPTPLVATMMRAPMSRMDILSDEEIKQVLASSSLKRKYNEVIDRESAYEILNAKIANTPTQTKKEQRTKQEVENTSSSSTSAPKTSTRKSTAQHPVVKLLTSATFIRGVFGVLSKIMKK
jgi:hypothetical protein